MSDLDSKANTSDVLTYEELMASNINVTNKIAGADNIKQLIDNRIFKIRTFISYSLDKEYAYYSNVPIDDRISAIIIGNANNAPFFRYCALFADGTNNITSVINDGNIVIHNNGDGTANIQINPVSAWGNYTLIVFYN